MSSLQEPIKLSQSPCFLDVIWSIVCHRLRDEPAAPLSLAGTDCEFHRECLATNSSNLVPANGVNVCKWPKIFTLPETNRSPLKIGHPKRKLVLKPLKNYVSFREGRCVSGALKMCCLFQHIIVYRFPRRPGGCGSNLLRPLAYTCSNKNWAGELVSFIGTWSFPGTTLKNIHLKVCAQSTCFTSLPNLNGPSFGDFDTNRKVCIDVCV